MIAIIDYGVGNLFSLKSSLKQLGLEAVVTADADTIRKLAGEANNINQLAHRANAGGFALVAVELVKLKNRIVEIINQLSDDWKNKKGKRV